jgi:hypothetical protein
MAALVTDNFRILNASNFIDSISDTSNSYYAFLGLSNPKPLSNTIPSGSSELFGDRSSSWDSSTPSPIDNIDYLNHYRYNSLFGKRITSQNARRVVKKVTWTANTEYDMYRHDYSLDNRSPNSQSTRLYDSQYYVVNSDFRVYLCIDNGSYGPSNQNSAKGNKSKDEPTFTDLEVSAAGSSNDGYLWKYLFTISPSDIIKFDSTEYIVLPNDWKTSQDSQIKTIRESGDSSINNNQIKKVYIENSGSGYIQGSESVCNIIGDGSGGKALVKISNDTNQKVESVKIVSGGSGYTYGYVDLSNVRPSTFIGTSAKLIVIIPPSRGHGYDLYSDLGADKVLIYARFDNSTRDFPVNTVFAQVGLIKDPESFDSSGTKYTANDFSSLYSMRLTSFVGSSRPLIGEKITQTLSTNPLTTATGYVASYDSDTQVLKYYVDRSLSYYNGNDSTDNADNSKVYDFTATPGSGGSVAITGSEGLSAQIDTDFGSSASTSIYDGINLGVTFTKGLANPEINRKTGDVIYIDNRTSVNRDSRQKEDVKIILEF